MRAQVSLIAIIGVIIVLVAIGAFFVFDRDPSVTPAGFADAEALLEQCLSSELGSAIGRSAQHGGEMAYVTAGPGTPRVVIDDDNRAVPVWVSYDTNKNDPLEYWRPKLGPNDPLAGGIDLSIEEQFAIALEGSVPSCFESGAQDIRIESEVRDAQVEVLIGDSIDATIRLSGSFDRDSRSASRISARTSEPSSFLELYETARAIADLEATSGVFSSYVRDIVSLDSGIDRPYPPIYAYDFSYGSSVWTAQGVQSELEADLEDSVPLITLATASTPEDLPYVVRRGLLDLERDGDKVGDRVFLSVEPVGVSVALNDGQIVSGQPVEGVIPFFSSLLPIRQYRTSYDIGSVFIVSLTSREDGLVFRFALEPRIDNNEVLRSGASAFSPATGDLAKASRAWCDDPTGSSASLSVSGADPEDVSIRFSCMSRSCTYPFSDTLTLPACVGGELEAFAPGVRFSAEPIDSMPGRTVSVSFDARTERSIDLDVSIVRTRGLFSDDLPSSLERLSTRDLDVEETVIFTFESLEFDHTAIGIVSGSVLTAPTLYDGAYEVSAQALRHLDHTVRIPEDEICPGISLGTWCPAGTQTIEAIDFTDTLVLATYEDIGTVLIDSDATVEVELPIFDLEAVPFDERKASHIGFYEVLDGSFDDLGSLEVIE